MSDKRQRRHKKHIVNCSETEQSELRRLTATGKASARVIKRANILLLAHQDKSDQEISQLLSVGAATVVRTRQHYVVGGLAAALYERPRPGRPPVFSGQQRAEVTALACSPPPEGYARWSLRLLADRVVELELVECISPPTVSDILKKTNSNRI